MTTNNDSQDLKIKQMGKYSVNYPLDYHNDNHHYFN